MRIKTASEQFSDRPLVGSVTTHRLVLGGYILFGFICIAVYALLRGGFLSFTLPVNAIFSKLSLAGVFIAIVMIISRFAERIVEKRVHNRGAGYNIIRIIRFASIIIAILIVISFLKSNWYAAAVSLGLISLILGFALQTPIASLIGWFYIIIRTPFRVGDRIQVGTFTGDVVEISYLDTTLAEFAGNYMSNDLPSGRLIRFPNSLVFTSEVYNYSWNNFPFIWNEIPFHVAYESDLGFVEETIRRVAIAEIGDKMEESVKQLKSLLREIPVEEPGAKEYPFVQFRTNANTWVEVLLIYLAEPKHSGSLRSRLIKQVLSELLKESDRVMFPKSNAR